MLKSISFIFPESEMPVSHKHPLQQAVSFMIVPASFTIT